MTRRITPRGELPLIAWGEELRWHKVAQRRLRRRIGVVAVLIGVVMASAALPPTPRLVWNASASAPIGLYRVSPGGLIRRGDRIVARVPLAIRHLAASHRYIPANVPLVKRVGAVPGDTVCALGATITVDGKAVALRRARDGSGRPLPWWTGCRLLRQGEVFLLAAEVPASFDGRYFGVSSSADIIGTATPLWTR